MLAGIYYQASILGQTVTWIVPYPLGQSIPSDVDFKVMLSFLELYETLVGFVNFKLYLDENLAYPPKIDQALYAKGAGLAAYNVESIASRQQQQQQQQALTDAPKATGAKPDAEQQVEKTIIMHAWFVTLTPPYAIRNASSRSKERLHRSSSTTTLSKRTTLPPPPQTTTSYWY